MNNEDHTRLPEIIGKESNGKREKLGYRRKERGEREGMV